MAYKVTVPVRVKRIEDVEWVFEVENEEEAKELVDYIKSQGLVCLNPDYEEVIKTCEEDMLEVYEDEMQIKYPEKGEDDSQKP